jgi:hypothetical protein
VKILPVKILSVKILVGKNSVGQMYQNQNYEMHRVGPKDAGIQIFSLLALNTTE